MNAWPKLIIRNEYDSRNVTKTVFYQPTQKCIYTFWSKSLVLKIPKLSNFPPIPSRKKPKHSNLSTTNENSWFRLIIKLCISVSMELTIFTLTLQVRLLRGMSHQLQASLFKNRKCNPFNKYKTFKKQIWAYLFPTNVPFWLVVISYPGFLETILFDFLWV